jgi:disulfide bond formation protein DsbB
VQPITWLFEAPPGLQGSCGLGYTVHMTLIASRAVSSHRRPFVTATLAAVTLAAAALIAGAWWFELVLGLLPCKLCLQQRWPHYAAIGIGLAALLAALAGLRLERMALVLLALVFAVSTGLGAYHAGVEWGWFLGPNDCGGAAAPVAGTTADFMRQLQTTRVVSCTEAAWRFVGLSLAGWNAVLSVVLAGLSLWVVTRRAA